MTLLQNPINHIAMVIDASGSMDPFTNNVVKVADGNIAWLADRSKELDQETRITIYTFNDDTKNVIYDMDVLRVPSIAGEYRPSGNTALIKATIQAIEDLQTTPTKYGDHAFLLFVLTDGEENVSRIDPSVLKSSILTLPENWTVACLVPNQRGEFSAKTFGFPAGNISVWDARNAQGVREVGETIRRTTDSFLTGRAQGIRGTRNLFQLDTQNLTGATLKSNLLELHFGQYEFFPVTVVDPLSIADFVRSKTRVAYALGSAYYQLTKTEEIQVQKKIAIRERKSGKVYTGGNARKILNLPDYTTKVAPSYHPDYDIFVQSTSVNRKLVPGTNVLLLSVSVY